MSVRVLSVIEVAEIAAYPETGDPWKSHEAITTLTESHEALRDLVRRAYDEPYESGTWWNAMGRALMGDEL